MPVQKHPTTVDLGKLRDGPQNRAGLGATQYAIDLAIKARLIERTERPDHGPRGTHYRLTKRGRDRLRRAAKA